MTLQKFASFFGLDQQSNPQLVAPESSSDLLNVKLHPVGSCGSREGYTVWESPTVSGTDAPTQVDGLATLKKISDDRIVMLAFAPDHIYRTKLQEGTISWSLAATHASTAADLTYIAATARYDTHGECLFIADGSRVPWIEKGLDTALASLTQWPIGLYVDGTGTKGYPDSTTSGPEWRDWTANPPKGLMLRGEGRQDRMYAWGFADDTNRIDFSELGVPWNMLKTDVDTTTPDDSAADGGWFYAIEDDQDYVIGVAELYDMLVVLKRNSTLIYRGLAGSYSQPLRLEQNRPVGCVSYRSVVRAHNELYWMSDQGPVSLSGVIQYGDLIFERDEARKIKDDLSDLNRQQLDKIISYHEPEHARVVWFVPASGSTDNNRAFCYYYDAPRWSRWSGRYTEVACVHVGPGATTQGDTIYAGDYDGSIRELNVDTYDGEDTSLEEEDPNNLITSYFHTQWVDMGDSDVRKRLKYLDVIAGDVGAEGITLQVTWDYSTNWQDIEYLVKIFGDPAAYWDYAKWDEAVWDAVAAATMRWAATGTGHLAKFSFTGGSRPWQLMGWKPVFSLKGTR